MASVAIRPLRYDALTGVRFFAALWVVAYHIKRANQGWLEKHHPDLVRLLDPVLGQAHRALDLFFVLSGFVLALNYLERIGDHPSLRTIARYLWLRVARIWPTYLAITLFAGFAIWFRHWRWNSASVDELTWNSLVQQLFLVQMWDQPTGKDSSWAGPAWSLSAEWLAYVLFPLLAVVALGLTRRLNTPGLVTAAVLSLTPLFLGLVLNHRFAYAWGWAPRVLSLFVAGMFTAAVLRAVSVSAAHRRAAGRAAPAILLAVAVWIALTETVLPGWWAGFLVVAWLPFVYCLTVGRGPLIDALSQRWIVLGGGASFALYLLHGPVLKLLRDLTTHTALFHVDRDLRIWVELAAVPVLVLASMAIYRWWEEPTRRVLTRPLLPRQRMPESARVREPA
ncbi:acyltransferase family protein [Nocardioides sp. Bht2]|uniref:acyltransferase family protein n=1 Tax=Nocardioides sp. Bht2 TaxID=3392297 RepID=UPI0039B53203